MTQEPVRPRLFVKVSILQKNICFRSSPAFWDETRLPIIEVESEAPIFGLLVPMKYSGGDVNVVSPSESPLTDREIALEDENLLIGLVVSPFLILPSWRVIYE